MSSHPVILAITQQRVIAIVRASSREDAVAAGRALFAAGCRAVEVSLTTPGALAAIEQLAAEVPSGAFLGVGTVLNSEMAGAATSVGASFVVAPTMRHDVIERAHHDGAAVIPGASTPSEMALAHGSGADLIKVFPASLWTPAAVRDVLVALPDLQLVPTGGITAASAPEWLRAGCVAVGLGGALTGHGADGAARARRVLASLAG